MTKILCYNENCCNDNGFDNVINHPDAILLETTASPSTINKMINSRYYLSKSELEDMFPIENFDKVYWTLFDNEFVDILD